jgi:hypothetical protein
VTTKSIPNAHVALLKILRMVLANELKMLNNRLHDLYRYDPDTFGAKLANRKNIRETESMIEELSKIDGALERAMRM